MLRGVPAPLVPIGRSLALGLVLCMTAACSGSDDAVSDSGEDQVSRSADVIVASFDFPESELVAEIYAQALESEGLEVRRELTLGPRELVVPAFRQGHVDVVPEYLGTALRAADPETPVDLSDRTAVTSALADAVATWDAAILEPAPAQNQNGLVVTSATAQRYGLEAVSDLTARADTMTLGGPPECATRRHCLQGLADTYGLHFEDFTPLARAEHVVRALEEGVVDVGVLFTTDGVLAPGDLVLLADDRHLQPVENLVPMVRRAVVDGEQGPRLAATLDAVSAQLTTESLRVVNWRVTVAGNEPAAEAHAWLVRHGLVERG